MPNAPGAQALDDASGSAVVQRRKALDMAVESDRYHPRFETLGRRRKPFAIEEHTDIDVALRVLPAFGETAEEIRGDHARTGVERGANELFDVLHPAVAWGGYRECLIVPQSRQRPTLPGQRALIAYGVFSRIAR